MSTRDLRASARIAVSQRGMLKSGGPAWFPCLVHDVSDHGFLLMCTEALPVGQVLEFKCDLFPGKSLNCKIEIRHVSDAGMGTRISEIDSNGTGLLRLYLQDQYSITLNKTG